jgi:hypothetical protein
MLIKKQLIVGFLFKFSVFTHMLIKKQLIQILKLCHIYQIT